MQCKAWPIPTPAEWRAATRPPGGARQPDKYLAAWSPPWRGDDQVSPPLTGPPTADQATGRGVLARRVHGRHDQLQWGMTDREKGKLERHKKR